MIDNYDALTLGLFLKIDAVLEGEGEDIDKQVRLIALLSGMTEDEVLLLPLADYAALAERTAFLREPCKPTEIHEDWRAGDLVPVLDYTKINTAQYVDFQTFATGFPQSLPQLLSVFLVPEGKAYNDGYDVLEVQRRVEAMPLADALGLSAFFFERFLALTAASLDYLEDARKKARGEKKKRLEATLALARSLTSGDGSLT